MSSLSQLVIVQLVIVQLVIVQLVIVQLVIVCHRHRQLHNLSSLWLWLEDLVCSSLKRERGLLAKWKSNVFVVVIMSSGFGIHGGVSRCFEHFQDINRCIVRRLLCDEHTI